MPEELSREHFGRVVAATPLISIDLLVRDDQGRILTGLRRNRPAQGFWFVPGGRILKGEHIAAAFKRICSDELGMAADFKDARFVGCFEHFYDDAFVPSEDSGTHYVVLAFDLWLTPELSGLPVEQHSAWEWRHSAHILVDAATHPHVRELVRAAGACPGASDCIDLMRQYDVVAARRSAMNSLLWQTPVLSLSAQAFLFTIALNPPLGPVPRATAAALALVTAAGSLQLLVKHRAGELADAIWLERFERANAWRGLEAINARHDLRGGWLVGIPSHQLWAVILFLFGLAALLVLISLMV